MNCDEVRDLLAAYALGTATAEEREIVEQHLDACSLHPELAELQAAGVAMSSAAPEIPPPAGLKDRILESAAAGSAGGSRRFRWLAGGYAVAAVLAIAVAGLIAWNVVLQLGGGEDENFVHFYRGVEGDWLRLETVLGEPHANVSLGGLQQLAAGQEYQIWATRDGAVFSVGVFNTNPEGGWAGDFSFAFFTGDNVWITVEQTGGSELPTSDPVVRTRF